MTHSLAHTRLVCSSSLVLVLVGLLAPWVPGQRVMGQEDVGPEPAGRPQAAADAVHDLSVQDLISILLDEAATPVSGESSPGSSATDLSAELVQSGLARVRMLGPVPPLTQQLASAILAANDLEVVVSDEEAIVVNQRLVPEVPNGVVTAVLPIEQLEENAVGALLIELLRVRHRELGRRDSDPRIVSVGDPRALVIRAPRVAVEHGRFVVSSLEARAESHRGHLRCLELRHLTAHELVTHLAPLVPIEASFFPGRLFPGRDLPVSESRPAVSGPDVDIATASSQAAPLQLLMAAESARFVVAGPDAQQIDLLREVLQLLDSRNPAARTSVRLVRVKHRHPAVLVRQLAAERGGGASRRLAGNPDLMPYRIVPHDPTGSIILQAEPPLMRILLATLEEIDTKSDE